MFPPTNSGHVAALLVCCLLCALAPPSGAAELLCSVYEELPPGTLVGNVRDVVNIPTSVAGIKFNMLKTVNRSELFHVDGAGNVTTAVVIDREALCAQKPTCVYDFDIAVLPLRHFEIVRVQVEILDVNDHSPTFPQPELHVQISENARVGYTLLLEPAGDDDVLHNAALTYELKSDGRGFAIQVSEDAFGGTVVALVVTRELDREAGRAEKVQIVAADQGVPRRTGSVIVNIDVTDTNDNAPVFEKQHYERQIMENVAPSTTVLRVRATDSDHGSNGVVEYSLSTRNTKQIRETFGINPETGELFVKGIIDYEHKTSHHVYVEATDKGVDPLSSVAIATINVMDENDNTPLIRMNLLTAVDGVAFISESAPEGSFVAKLSIIDTDSDDNGRATGEILPGGADYFSLKPLFVNEYMLVTSKLLDREAMPEYNLTIRVRDMGEPSRSSSVVLRVVVTDENDNPPSFNQSLFVARVAENNDVGQVVARVVATDRDEGLNAKMRYHIPPPHDIAFGINPLTGVITTRARFDREETPSIDVKVIASDSGDPPRLASTVVRVQFADVNDNAPQMKRKFYSFTLDENEPISTLVGSVQATDADVGDNGAVVYSFDTAVLEFSIDPVTGGIYTNRKLDREKKDTYTFVVRASDRGESPRHDRSNVTVYISDTNDNIPVIIFPSGSDNVVFLPETAPAGKSVCVATAYDEDEGEDGRLSFDIMDGNGYSIFRINEVSGEIVTTRALRGDWIGLHKLILSARDNGTPQNVAMTVLNVIIHPGNATTNETLMYLLSLHLKEDVDEVPLARPGNVMLMIIMACVSAALIAAVIILVIMYRRKSRENLAYNVRTEAQRIFQGLKRRKASSASDIEDGQGGFDDGGGEGGGGGGGGGG
ncbi:PREDICTED: protocadherin-11 X-linked-like, partial [Priapulus caudatus]|uniref:Protocadherin-11 X-linked-like n=1 Tax=Priapulus caudatus TaxID=37621 RepID=A0ABM1DZP1_PRICU